MSTRATYLLPIADYNNQLVCFYIHQDGYPAGAANYFHKMHQCKNVNGGFAKRFLRANNQAELIHCHEAGTDTEFRYTLDHQDILRAWVKDKIDNQWRIFYKGAWYHFVNKYLEESQHLHVFKLSKNVEHETLMTIEEAKKWVSAFMKHESLTDYAREGAQAIQAQIDAIVAQQKMHGGNAVNSKLDTHCTCESIQTEDKRFLASGSQSSLAVRQLWKERFAIFALELEEKIADWAKKNQAEYCEGYHHRVAELKRFINEFYWVLNQLIEAWTQSSGVLQGDTAGFDLSRAINQLRDCMIEKHGFKLEEAIRVARVEYGYGGDDDEEAYEHEG